MRVGTRFLILGGLLLLAACTRTVVVQGPARDLQPRGSRPPPRTPPGNDNPAPPPPVVRRNEILIPPGHLPRPGECRVWIPGTPPGRQPRPRSRACAGIEALAPAGSWIVYRRADDQRLIYIRLIDERRPSIVIRNRIFDGDTWELLREEDVREDRRPDDRPGQDRPREQPERPREPPPAVQPPGNRPPELKPPEQRPPEQRPPEQRPPEQRPPLPPREIIPPVQPPPGQQPPPVQPRDTQPRQQPPPPVQPPVQPPPVQPPPVQPPPVSNVTLSIPPGHLPELGECRVWIERLPPGQQPRPKSRACDGILSVAPAASWVLYRPANDRDVLHVRMIDERRAGVVVRVRVFDLDSKRLIREENP